jgi:hypothetical protein
MWYAIHRLASLVHPRNPSPLDQVRDIGLRPKNAFEIAVAKP